MLSEVIQGMWVTIKHSLRSRETVQYPEVKEEMPVGYRGLHKLLLWEDGLERCVGCKLCSAACPVDCIYVESAENDLVFTIRHHAGIEVLIFVTKLR